VRLERCTRVVTDYTALRAASETFRVLLKSAITDSTEPDLTGIQIDLRSPRALAELNLTSVVSLWLYELMVQPDLLNTPPHRVTDDAYEHRPLPLELLYLITAIHADAKTQLALTGRALQIVNDHPRLRGADLQDTLAGSDAELRLSIDATSLISTTELWYSLRSPFHLSVPVRLQVASIDSLRPASVGSPVVTRRAQITQQAETAA
jgi:Pvc16 N-terminal domain